MRMHPHCTKYLIIFLRNPNSFFTFFNRISNTDHALDACGVCSAENGIQILRELWSRKVTM